MSGWLRRSRQQRRNAAREREAEAESRLRELQGLHMQSQDRVRGVDSYQRAGKAERLQEVRAALEATQQQLHNQEARLKAGPLSFQHCKLRIGKGRVGSLRRSVCIRLPVACSQFRCHALFAARGRTPDVYK